MDTPTIPSTPSPDRQPTRPARDLVDTLRMSDPPPAPGEVDPATPAFGRYRILRELGRGGMGAVFLAHDPQLGREVALKLLLAGGDAGEEEVRRFHREAQAAARLSHRNVISTYDVGVAGGKHYFTMEAVRGGSVAALRKTRRRLPPHEAARLVREAAEGVAFAHAAGIVHRDLKPENLLLDEAGVVKVSDFGLARILTDSEAQRLTRTGVIMGTPAYMSPEQAEGASAVDARSDVYSLGSILYDLVTGELPYAGGTPTEIVFRKISRDPVPPRRLVPQIPPDLETIIEKSMEREPERRYPSAREMADDLGRYLDGEPIAARPISVLGRWRRRVWKHRGWWAAAMGLAALAAGSAGTAWMLWSRQEEVLHAKEHAEAGAAEMRLAMEKAQSVSRVLARWARVASAVRRLERVSGRAARPGGDSAAAAEDWAEVERFLADTPADSASQATARAFVGWAAVLAGRRDEARRRFQEAVEADPDVPYGRLMDAMWCFSAYLDEQQLPVTNTSAAGILFGPRPPETASMTATRERMEALLAEAARAKVWGKEGAGEFAVAQAAIRAMQDGEYERAEAEFTRALESPDLRALTTPLQLGRACVRYLRMRFAEARADVEDLREAAPDHIARLGVSSLVKWAQAQAGSQQGEDPRPLLEDARRDLDEILRQDPNAFWASANRGLLWTRLGEAAASRGQDPAAAYDAAQADFERSMRGRPGVAWNHLNRGGVHARRAEREIARGGDPGPHLERALADFGEALRLDSTLAAAPMNRALVYLRQAEAEAARGEDPTAALQQATAEATRALELDPALLPALVNRGAAWLRLGERMTMVGMDAGTMYDQAAADADAVLRQNPDVAEAYALRGQARLRRAEAEGGRGADPRPGIDAAIADLGEAVRRNPALPDVFSNRGSAHSKRALADHARGGDPSASIAAALADFDESMRQNPENGLVYNNRGAVHLLCGHVATARGEDARAAFDAALADFDQVLQRQPNLWQSHAVRGEILFLRGDFAASAAAYERTRELSGGMLRVIDHLVERAQARASGQDGCIRASGGAEWDRELLAADRIMQAGDRAGARVRYEKGLTLLADHAKALPAEERKTLARDPGLRAVLRLAHFNLACSYAVAARDAAAEEASGLRDLAFAQLDKAVRFGWADAVITSTYADLLPLHDDPRWAPTLEKMMR